MGCCSEFQELRSAGLFPYSSNTLLSDPDPSGPYPKSVTFPNAGHSHKTYTIFPAQGGLCCFPLVQHILRMDKLPSARASASFLSLVICLVLYFLCALDHVHKGYNHKLNSESSKDAKYQFWQNWFIARNSIVPKGYTPYKPYTLRKFQDNLGCTQFALKFPAELLNNSTPS